jgi:hypothetical protein
MGYSFFCKFFSGCELVPFSRLKSQIIPFRASFYLSYPWCWSFVAWPFQGVSFSPFWNSTSTLDADSVRFATWSFQDVRARMSAAMHNVILYVSILFVLEAIHFMLRACAKSLLDAESMCPKPTWCWEHVSQAYLIEHELSHQDAGVIRWFVAKVHYRKYIIFSWSCFY